MWRAAIAGCDLRQRWAIVARLFQQRHVALEIGEAQHRQAALAAAEKFTGAAQQQILACDFEAVGQFENHLEPCAGEFRQGRLVQQHAHRFAAAAPDAPAQLMQLRQPHALGVFDHHQRGVGHVDADFDDGGGHQQLDFMRLECGHHRLFFVRLQPSVNQADAQFRQLFHQRRIGVLRGLQLQLLRFLDQRAHPVGLAAGKAGVASRAPARRRGARR